MKHFVHVSSSIRMHAEINARVGRSRRDGSVEIVDLVAPTGADERVGRTRRADGDLEDVLAILGREDVRWHDLYHVFEIIEAEVGERMFSDSWVTKTAVKRFPQTANSRRAIGGEARHGHDRLDRRSSRSRARRRTPSSSVSSAGGWREGATPASARSGRQREASAGAGGDDLRRHHLTRASRPARSSS